VVVGVYASPSPPTTTGGTAPPAPSPTPPGGTGTGGASTSGVSEFRPGLFKKYTGGSGGAGAGGAKPPTTSGGASGGTGTGGSVAGGGSTPSTNTAIQNTALSMAQGVISDYTKNYSNNPFIVDAKSSQDAINFLSYLNSLKQSNPTLYNQLMQNPTIQQAVKHANLIVGNYEAAGGYAPLTMTKQQFGLTTANNLIAQINQNMQSGNYQQALQYAQMLKTLAQQYNLPINTQSINTLINELTILSQLPNPPSTQPPRLSPQLMRAIAGSDPGFYRLMNM